MRIQPSRDDLLELTREWSGDRFDDGRPRVPDSVLDELRSATLEQIWSVLWDAGYERQFEGGWRESHPGRRLIGRAVTAQFLPQRPDLDRMVVETANREGRPTRSENQNWLVVESLAAGDVMVVDIFGKVYEGTVIGDRLGTALNSRTGAGAGAVIHGGIRDLEGIESLDAVNVFHRGVDPTPIRNVTLGGLNTPVRIGGVTVLPGDVVFGTSAGVLVVPPHLAEQAARAAVDTRARDVFCKIRLAEGLYSTAQIDVEVWSEAIEADFNRWSRSRPPALS